MKKIFFLFSLVLCLSLSAQNKRALILIDIQNFYYPGGASALHQPEIAGKNAQLVLEHFRENNELVVHIRHNFEPGGEIHEDVQPLDSEKIISKDHVNSFKDTDLLEYLQANNISELVLVGMQTHMCLEAATRAASDYNFKCTVIEDACATKDLKFGDKVIKAEDVHFSTLSTLKSYATITNVKDFFHLK